MSTTPNTTPETFASAKHNAKRKVAGALMLTALTLGGGAGGVAMLNVAHAAEATATATTQARTESTVNLTAKDFTGEAPKETVQNYVNWVLNQDKVSPYNTSNTTTYKVNVADLVGKGLTIKPGTLQLGIGAYGGEETRLDLPIYGKQDTATPRASTLQYGYGEDAPVTITADADGNISIPRIDDAKMDINILYSVEVEGGKTVTQMITIKAPKPTVEAGTFSASTTLGKIGTTQDDPTEVKVNDSGSVTFTYTNNSKLTATTAKGEPKSDEKIHLTISRDGKDVELPVVEIAPGETKTFSVEGVTASSKAGEVTGADFKLTEILPQHMESISVYPCDNLAASPIISPATNQDFLSLFTSGKYERVAPILPDGATVNLHDAKAPADYIVTNPPLGGNCGGEATESYVKDYTGRVGIGFGDRGASNYYSWNGAKENVTNYSVYVKPVAAPVETPAPTPTPDVTPEPTPSETPTPVPSESTPPAPVKPSPSTPAEPTPSNTPTPEPVPTSPTAIPSVTPSVPVVTPSAEPTPTESVPPTPTQEATTPVPSVSPSEPAVEKPSEPGVKPSEPAKPIEAKTGHEFDSAKPVFGGILGALALGAVAGLWIFGRKKKGATVKPEATASETDAEATAEGTDSK